MRADGRQTFEEWARARQQHLVRSAYLLTGDYQRAEDLVQEALVKAATRWDRLRDGNADAWVRTFVYREHVSWWRSNAGSIVREPPLVRGNIAVGVYGANGTVNPEAGYPAVLAEANGVAVVDLATGSVVAALRLGQGKDESTTLLGWAGSLPIIGLHTDDEFPTVTHVVIWDYSNGKLGPLAELPSPYVAWGSGREPVRYL